MAYQRNEGHLPRECEIWADVETEGVLARSLVGYRNVHVRTFGGPTVRPYDSKKAGAAPWPSAGSRPVQTNWGISNPPHPFEIKEWEIA